SASASENTAMMWMPSRRAVRITRHEISPRLAIRILSNMSVPGPRRSAFVEERGQALLAFGGNAHRRDEVGGGGVQGVAVHVRLHGADQGLGLGRGHWPGLEQQRHLALHCVVQPGR